MTKITENEIELFSIEFLAKQAMVGKMIKSLFNCCLIRNLKNTEVIVEIPYTLGYSVDNLFHRCLIEKKIVTKTMNLEFIKWR